MRFQRFRLRTTLSLAALLGSAIFAPAAFAGWDPLIRASELYAEGQPANTMFRGGTPTWAAVGDFNGDGLPDVVACNHEDTQVLSIGKTVSVLLHVAQPGQPRMFNAWWLNYSVGNYPFQVTTADLNLDGKSDILTFNYAPNGADGSNRSISILRSKTSGFFPAKTTTIAGATGVVAQDLNGDLRPDVVVGVETTATSTSGILVMLAVNGDSLAPATKYLTGLGSGLAVPDATGDGIPDLLGIGPAGIYVLPGNNTGVFNTVIGPVVTDSNPGSVAVANLNGDAFPDIVTARRSDGTVKVYLGTGGGSVQAPLTFPDDLITIQNLNLLTGDVDGDGDVDLVLVTGLALAGGNISVLRNNGNGSFGPSERYVGLFRTGGTQLVDINQDGRPDLVGSENVENNANGNTVGIVLNDGSGGFITQRKILNVAWAVRQVAGDFNRDGLPDLAVSDSAGVRIGLGNGAGGFAAGSFLSTPSSPLDLATGDLNRDGKPDLLAQVGSQVYDFTGVGDGTFALTQLISGRVFSRSVADMNRDGRLDFVGSDAAGSAIVVYLQQTNQIFAGGTPKTPAVGLAALCTGDWNRDGVLDVAVAGPTGLSTIPGSPGFPGTLGTESVVISGKNYIDLCTGDFNRDGIPDLAARLQVAGASVLNGIDVFLGTGTGAFGAPTSFGALGGYGASMDSWDTNRDGVPDLITSSFTAGSNFSVDALIGNGGGSFSGPLSYSLGMPNTGAGNDYARISGADVDRDGTPDILMGMAGCDSIGIPAGNSLRLALASPPARGNGYLSSAFYTTIGAPNQVVVGDLNRDGKLDAVTASVNAAPGVAVHLAAAGGALGPATTLTQSWATFRVRLADLNRDGILDIVASNFGVGLPRVSSMLGTGDGTFGPRNDLFINANLDFEVGDMNRDGIPDVVTSTQDSIRVLIGNGNGTFTPGSAVAITPVYDLDLADLDRNGVLDVICAKGNKVSVLFSHGDGTLGSPIDLIVPVTNCTTLCVADFNRDGFADIVAPDGGTYYTVWGSAGSPYNQYALTNLPFSAFDLAVGEAQADGEPFLYVARNAQNVEVLKWNPLGAFESVGSYVITGQPESIALGDMDRDGAVDILSASSAGTQVSVTLHGAGGVTVIASAPSPRAPRAALRQNYPNPFNPETTIHFTLATRDHARVTVFDTQGRLVAELVDKDLPAGDHAVQWRGVDRVGRSVGSGVYFYRLTTGSGYRESRRMVVVK